MVAHAARDSYMGVLYLRRAFRASLPHASFVSFSLLPLHSLFRPHQTLAPLLLFSRLRLFEVVERIPQTTLCGPLMASGCLEAYRTWRQLLLAPRPSQILRHPAHPALLTGW
ncbi:hypothetical protein E2C01_075307 [Portunus trituberculatus]|uniref:Uncharacterized protein n=1 Tax=Portunus trituberculatus TaxID=210409 RepID=A0A5B7IFT6_PORTR|nr:hypothetical protein [Portunus trituberculatus]